MLVMILENQYRKYVELTVETNDHTFVCEDKEEPHELIISITD